MVPKGYQFLHPLDPFEGPGKKWLNDKKKWQ